MQCPKIEELSLDGFEEERKGKQPPKVGLMLRKKYKMIVVHLFAKPTQRSGVCKPLVQRGPVVEGVYAVRISEFMFPPFEHCRPIAGNSYYPGARPWPI